MYSSVGILEGSELGLKSECKMFIKCLSLIFCQFFRFFSLPINMFTCIDNAQEQSFAVEMQQIIFVKIFAGFFLTT
jgi:hypothetical protein